MAMDSYNYEDIIQLAHPSTHSKVKLMRTFDPQGKGDVPDPYQGNEKDFEQVFNLLDRSVDGLIKELLGKA